MLVKKSDSKQKTGTLSYLLAGVFFLGLLLLVYFVVPLFTNTSEATIISAPGFSKEELRGGFSDTVLQDSKLDTLEQRVDLPIGPGQPGKRNPFNE